MSQTESWDNLNILTKKEIIEFLKCWTLRLPSKYEIESFKWELTVQKLQKEMNDYLNDDTGKRLAKEINKLAEKFNKEKDVTKRIRLFDKRIKLLDQFQKHEKKYDEIIKKQEKNDKYFELINKRS